MVHSQGIWLGDSVELDKTKTELRTARWVHPVYYGVPNWHTDPNKHTGMKILSR